jgi:hypothetical protein
MLARIAKKSKTILIESLMKLLLIFSRRFFKIYLKMGVITMLILLLVSQEKSLDFDSLKQFVADKIEKYIYFDVDSNFIKRIKKTQSFDELVFVLDSFRGHLGKFDYLEIEEENKKVEQVRKDIGLTAGGRLLPSSPSFKKCAILTNEYVFDEYKTNYTENGICSNGRTAYISSGEINFETFVYLLLSLNYDTIIIDFRDNVGGELTYAYYIVGLLSNYREIEFKYIFRDAIIVEKNKFLFPKNKDLNKKKIIILSNKNTYSASEWIIYKLSILNPNIEIINKDGRTGGKRTIICSFGFSYENKNYNLLVPCGYWIDEKDIFYVKNKFIEVRK